MRPGSRRAMLHHLKVERIAATMDPKAAEDFRKASQTLQLAIMGAMREHSDTRGRMRGEWTSPPDPRNRR